MIKIEGPNISVLHYKIPHHTEALVPMRDALLKEIFLRFGPGDEVHRLIQHSKGHGSWELRLADGRQFHFRAAGERIVIKDSWFRGSPIVVLRNPVDCIDYIQRLEMRKAA